MGAKEFEGRPDTYSNVNEMPVCRMTVIGAVLAHRRHKGPVLEGEAPNGYGLEELGELLILGEVGLGRRDS
jgi:hypothetical protein